MFVPKFALRLNEGEQELPQEATTEAPAAIPPAAPAENEEEAR